MILDLTTLAKEVHHLGMPHGVWMESIHIIDQSPLILNQLINRQIIL